jgi:hypothetical protein
MLPLLLESQSPLADFPLPVALCSVDLGGEALVLHGDNKGRGGRRG